MKKKFLIVIGVLLGVIALVGGGVVVHNKVQSNKENKAIEEKKLEEKKKKEEEKEKEKLEAEKEKKKLEAEQEAQRLNEENDQKIADLKVRKSNLQAKEITLKVQKNEEFMNNGFTERYYQLGNELSDLSDEIRAVEREIDDLEDNTFEPVYEDEEDFTDVEDFISDFTEDTQDKTESIFEFSKYMFIIPLVLFITVFAVIVTIAIKSTKNFGSMIHGVSTKEMLNDLSDVAVKMAKDLNPTYKEFKCPNCNASLDPENTEIKKCTYCGAKLYKTVNTGHTNKSHAHKSHSHTSSSHSSNTHDSNSHKTK